MTGRTNQFSRAVIMLEVFHAEPPLLRFVSFLALVNRTSVSISIYKADISLAKMRVRHVSINFQILTRLKILNTVVACVGADFLILLGLFPTNSFQLLLRPF